MEYKYYPEDAAKAIAFHELACQVRDMVIDLGLEVPTDGEFEFPVYDPSEPGRRIRAGDEFLQKDIAGKSGSEDLLSSDRGRQGDPTPLTANSERRQRRQSGSVPSVDAVQKETDGLAPPDDVVKQDLGGSNPQMDVDGEDLGSSSLPVNDDEEELGGLSLPMTEGAQSDSASSSNEQQPTGREATERKSSIASSKAATILQLICDIVRRRV